MPLSDVRKRVMPGLDFSELFNISSALAMPRLEMCLSNHHRTRDSHIREMYSDPACLLKIVEPVIVYSKRLSTAYL